MNATLSNNQKASYQNQNLRITGHSIPYLNDLPKVKYESEKNVLFLKGNSTGDLINEFYEGVIESIQNHFKDSDKLSLYLYINELNTPSLKCFFYIFKVLKKEESKGKKAKVTRFFDLNNQSMMDSAFDFSDLFNLQVTIVAV